MHSDRDTAHRWLTDIRDNIALAENFTAGVTYEAFNGDMMRLYAVIRCLEITRKPHSGCPTT